MILILVQNPVLPEATLSKPGRFFKKLLVLFTDFLLVAAQICIAANLCFALFSRNFRRLTCALTTHFSGSQ